jgi:transcriptional regulator with XRE-family HTH domain
MSDIAALFQRSLRARRKALGLSQADLAGRLGLQQSYISQLESGALGPPSVDRAHEIAVALETNLYYLLGLTDDPLPLQGGEAPPPYMEEMMRILRSLDEPAHAAVLAHARVVADLEARRNEALRLEVRGVVRNAYAAIESSLPADRADALFAEIERAIANLDDDAIRAIADRFAPGVE